MVDFRIQHLTLGGSNKERFNRTEPIPLSIKNAPIFCQSATGLMIGEDMFI